MTTLTANLLQEAAEARGIVASDYTPPTGHNIIVNRVRLHYLDWGSTGMPMVFLHGGGQNCHTWDMVALQLRGKYRCIAPDTRNHGDSEMTPERSPYGADAEDIHALVEALGLRRFVLAGMSMGGGTLMQFAPKYPQGLEAAIIIDITPTSKPEGAGQIRELMKPVAWESFEEAVAASMKASPGRHPAVVRYGLLHALRQRGDGKWVWKSQMNPAGQGQQSEEEVKRFQARREAMWTTVQDIRCPALVVHGSRSQVIDRQLAERLATTVHKGEVVTVEGAGHSVQGDKPIELAAQILAFLKRRQIA